MSSFPSRGELKCAGISFIIAQSCWAIVIYIFNLDYNLYNVQEEADIILLHRTLSSSQHRTEMEIGTAIVFIAFPFMLMSLYGMHKLVASILDSTSGEMAVYLFANSYIIWITVNSVIIPALILVSTSFEWSFHEFTPSDDFVLTGYYIQAYAVLYQLEMMNCTAIADATLMISLFMTPVIMRYASNMKLQRITQAIGRRRYPLCRFIADAALVLSFLFIFMIVLFEFKRYGFHSPTGSAKYLMIWSFFWKFVLGIKLFMWGASDMYDQVKSVVDQELIIEQDMMDEEEDRDEDYDSEGGEDSDDHSKTQELEVPKHDYEIVQTR
eukprot:86842_1